MMEQNDKQKHVIQNDEVAGFGRGSLTTLPGFTGAAVLVGCALCAITACDAPGPGAGALLEATAAIPAGANCPTGGSAVSVGHDVNGNGVLDREEVEHVTNVCNLEVPPTLTRIEVEPAGDHCASGGHAVKVGPDLNRSGTLDDSEVTSTAYACDPTDLFIGDFTADMWNSPTQVAALALARVVTGTLTLASDAKASLPRLVMVGGLTIAPGAPPASIDLPALTQISGSLLALASDLDALALPALVTVGGSVQFSTAPDLASLSLPALVAVGGSIQIDTAPDLASLSLPALTTVGQDVSVGGTPLLATAGLPALSTIGGALVLWNAPVLQDVDLPALTTVSRIFVESTGAIRVQLPRLVGASQVEIMRDTALHQLDLGSLVASDGATGAFGSVDIEFTALDALDLPVSSNARIVIAHNGALTSLRLARLSFASGLIIRDCPALVTLEAPQLFEVGDLWLTGPLTSLSLPSWLLVEHELVYASTGLAHLPPARLFPGASLSVSSNPALVDLRGLDLPATLSSVGIGGNPLINSLTGLESIAQLQTLQVDRNAALVDLTGLGSLVQASIVEVRWNAAMTSLHGLDQLSNLSNYLSIMDNPALTSLDGLDALENIGGALVVTRNPTLASLDGLAALQSVGLAYGTVNGGPSFYVTDNPALSSDAIAALLARIRHN